MQLDDSNKIDAVILECLELKKTISSTRKPSEVNSGIGTFNIPIEKSSPELTAEGNLFIKIYKAIKKRKKEVPPLIPRQELEAYKGDDILTSDKYRIKNSVVEYDLKKKISLVGKIKDKMYPSKSFLITMQYSNGTEKTWFITTGEEMFYTRGRGYHLRYENNRYDLNSNRYKLYFHEDHVEPIDRQIIRLPELQPLNGEDPRSFWSCTPHNVRDILKLEYVKAIVDVELSRYIKLCMLFIIINIFLTVINLVLTYRKGNV